MGTVVLATRARSFALGRPPFRGKEDFVRAQEKWSGFLEPGLLLGKTYYLERKRSEAERVFEELYRQTDSEDQALRDEAALWIALVYQSLDDSKKGLEWTQKLSGGSPTLKLTLEADFYRQLGKIQGAISRRRDLVAFHPEESRQSVELGWLRCSSRPL